MKKLVEGIVRFRRDILPGYRETFARLALGQKPDVLFIGCSDSRVAVNVFASTDPGDLFVVRNVGNMVPCCGENGQSSADESEAAAIEFALNTLNVSSIIVCGHSECGAMQALINGREKLEMVNLRSWLRHGDDSLETLRKVKYEASSLAPHNKLSQLNVIKQLEHLKTYPIVEKKIKEGQLSLHGWWFELKQADVYAFEESLNQFVLIDENQSKKILEKVSK
jgi:carbonic anhydrase